ncbi:hypothetical protein M422DRAFT_37004 [Sphaerobolus stellatus SS14]|uniref:Aspergillus nuclease S(1) n=1 Tax=Sphaerobolus stellatus (strain SS14) TaxID=990650 RepID=A0A0C9UVP0_SPHS4|nr:hypothetical protein M422DRAFT_37004 [Sphaerobolus stellatus SS14]
MQLPISLSLLALVQLVPQVAAWGAAGHEIVADIAQMHLFPSAREALCSVLPDYAKCQLGPVAAWADKIKYRNRWSSELHYVNGIGDHPGNHCVFGEEGWMGKPGINLLGGIRNTTDWMKDGKPGAEEALKFFVHFLGDMHMPLHLTGRAKGGNGISVKWNRRTVKFHGVWDGMLIAKEIRETPYKYENPLPNPQVESALRGAIYDPYIRQIIWEGVLNEWADEVQEWTQCPSSFEDVPNFYPEYAGSEFRTQPGQIPLNALRASSPKVPPTDDATVCPFTWGQPIHALNCEIVWPRELNSDNPPHIELDTPEYSGKLKKQKIVMKLLAMGGVRMAAVLNEIFADPEEVAALQMGRVLDLKVWM